MSFVLNAKTALFDMLTAWPWPGNQPAITWSAPTKSDDTNVPTGEHIFLDVTTLETPLDQMYAPRGWREAFNIPIVIDVYLTGDDERACETRADELYEAVIDLLNAARASHLNGTVTQLSGWTSQRAIAPYGREGWRCQITVDQDFVNAVQSP